jgi:hypothetical protein
MTTDKLSLPMRAALLGAVISEGGAVARLRFDVNPRTATALVRRGLVVSSKTRIGAFVLTRDGGAARERLLADAGAAWARRMDRAWTT